MNVHTRSVGGSLTEYAKKIANPSVCVSTMPELYREASTSVTAGGGSRIRTGDMLLAKQPLYQLSYTPTEVPWWA